ncbi:hypothetical protein KY334_04740 [Candidatus Woesearchaeota archaeon]|nr:hypothetical protein [Candidatus Woesearchaeota archaeon]
MLHKELVSIENFKDNNQLVIITNKNDLNKAISLDVKKVYLEYQLDSEDLENLSIFKYIRIYNNISLLDKIKHKNNFLEAIIPIEEYIKDNKIVELKVDRMIFEFNSKEQIEFIEKLFSDLILNDQYPFVKGIPMCNVAIQHTFELFNPENNKKACKGCIYRNNCSYKEDFDIKIKEKDEEFEKFIKDEGIIHRI